MSEIQSTNHVVMIRPRCFYANPQTAGSNYFQKLQVSGEINENAKACGEFDGLIQTLVSAGINVLQFVDTEQTVTPDALFPNNWISTHSDGVAVLYPMLAPNRRLERRADIMRSLAIESGFRISNLLDLSYWEESQRYLEGTGSMVLDRVNRTAYASISPRTHLAVLDAFAKRMRYELVVFNAYDHRKQAIYHTNVMLSIGTRVAVICAAAIDPLQRVTVLASLRSTGRQLVEITFEQMAQFAGNMLELTTKPNVQLMAMSTQAFKSLTPTQINAIERNCGAIIHTPISTIERLGGGSVRCMLAEIHLPRDA